MQLCLERLKVPFGCFTHQGQRVNVRKLKREKPNFFQIVRKPNSVKIGVDRWVNWEKELKKKQKKDRERSKAKERSKPTVKVNIDEVSSGSDSDLEELRAKINKKKVVLVPKNPAVEKTVIDKKRSRSPARSRSPTASGSKELQKDRRPSNDDEKSSKRHKKKSKKHKKDSKRSKDEKMSRSKSPSRSRDEKKSKSIEPSKRSKSPEPLKRSKSPEPSKPPKSPERSKEASTSKRRSRSRSRSPPIRKRAISSSPEPEAQPEAKKLRHSSPDSPKSPPRQPVKSNIEVKPDDDLNEVTNAISKTGEVKTPKPNGATESKPENSNDATEEVKPKTDKVKDSHEVKPEEVKVKEAKPEEVKVKEGKPEDSEPIASCLNKPEKPKEISKPVESDSKPKEVKVMTLDSSSSDDEDISIVKAPSKATSTRQRVTLEDRGALREERRPPYIDHKLFERNSELREFRDIFIYELCPKPKFLEPNYKLSLWELERRVYDVIDAYGLPACEKPSFVPAKRPSMPVETPEDKALLKKFNVNKFIKVKLKDVKFSDREKNKKR